METRTVKNEFSLEARIFCGKKVKEEEEADSQSMFTTKTDFVVRSARRLSVVQNQTRLAHFDFLPRLPFRWSCNNQIRGLCHPPLLRTGRVV